MEQQIIWQQATTTIFTGVVVLALSKIIESLCIGPTISYQKVVGEITHDLIYYAREYSTKNLKIEMYQKAQTQFRKSAARLQTYYKPLHWMNLWFMPSEEDIDNATKALIGLSNSIPPEGKISENRNLVNVIRNKLKITSYE